MVSQVFTLQICKAEKNKSTLAVNAAHEKRSGDGCFSFEAKELNLSHSPQPKKNTK